MLSIHAPIDSCPLFPMAGKVVFLMHIPLTGISSPSSSLFLIFFVLSWDFHPSGPKDSGAISLV